jgi:hypothetical protein
MASCNFITSHIVALYGGYAKQASSIDISDLRGEQIIQTLQPTTADE